MGSERLAVELERKDGGNVVLHVSGRLDDGTAALLEGVLYALRNDPATMVVDETTRSGNRACVLCGCVAEC